MSKKPLLHSVEDDKPNDEAATQIEKPGKFSLDKFKVKRAAAVSVETLLSALPCHSIAQAKDFVRLHPKEEEYWSDELYFVNVPIKGMKKDTVHLIYEELALRLFSGSKIIRHRLALATKPYDVFFLAHVPSCNLDNTWVYSNRDACEKAKFNWVQASSQKEEGIEGYKFSPLSKLMPFPLRNGQSKHLTT